ncbi:hypothetical protein IWQ60_003192 [Tieghemiomyces parasiticus]|uniref:Uncharacterized protein n=1 Tax=Tieghemiomyces parasiticus TaxID=78921 RepID=A0A9W8E0A9_9FUNG|nr:hypothetical protein IWQ60_003192 [Tieghemiomyces parasiticus]
MDAERIRREVAEQEAQLHEYAAVGNWKAVGILLKAGINPNSANAMNHWTALHWASKRGHHTIVALLLSYGADPQLRTKKGETARDVAATDAVDHVLTAYKQRTTASEAGGTETGRWETSLKEMGLDSAIVGDDSSRATLSLNEATNDEGDTFVPAYLRHPDLSKQWELPDGYVPRQHADAEAPAAEVRPVPVEAISRPPVPLATTVVPQIPAQTPSSVSNEEREVLVYHETHSDDHLLGAVFISPRASLGELAARIREELEGVPQEFQLHRYNGQREIPISRKQLNALVAQHFKNETNSLVLKPWDDMDIGF